MGNLPMLATNRLMAFAATSIMGIFLPIFLYEYFNFSLQAVLLFYFIEQVARIPFFVPGAKFFSRFGLTISMGIGMLGLATFYGSFFAISHGVNAPHLLFPLAVFGLILNTTLYWSPFHIEFAEFSDKKKIGQQLSFLFIAQRCLGIIAPILSGYLIMTYTFKSTFLIGMLLVLLSIIPLSYLPKTVVAYEFGYWETLRKLFAKPFRPLSFSMMAYGAESMIGVVAWPIFLYSIFKGDYLEIGLFSTAIILVSIVFQAFLNSMTPSCNAPAPCKR